MIYVFILYAIPLFHAMVYFEDCREDAHDYLCMLNIEYDQSDPKVQRRVMNAVGFMVAFGWPLFMLIDALEEMRNQDNDK